jgi:hypothetical protein
MYTYIYIHTFIHMYTHFSTGLSKQDQSALQLGRLIMSSVFNQPEVSTTDSVSRFFLGTYQYM